MKAFSTCIAIGASRERAWAVLVDVERWPEWTPTMLRVERLEPAPLAPGSRTRVEQPGLRAAVWTVTEWLPGLGFSWVARHPGLVLEAEHRIESAAQGCTATLSVRFGGCFGALAAAATGRLTPRYLALEAAGLKKRSEGTA